MGPPRRGEHDGGPGLTGNLTADVLRRLPRRRSRLPCFAVADQWVRLTAGSHTSVTEFVKIVQIIPVFVLFCKICISCFVDLNCVIQILLDS